MKKLSLLILTFIMVFCFSAVSFAAKPYKHPSYDFTAVREVHITKIDDREGEPAKNFHIDENAEAKVLVALMQGLGKQRLIATDETRIPLPEYNTDRSVRPNYHPRDIELRVIINHFGYTNVVEPGHYKDYTTKETHYYYDREGRRQSWTENVVRQRWVPENRYSYAYMSLIYNFYDLENGTLIASLSDSRERAYDTDPAEGMLGRSVKDCFTKIF